MKNDPKQLISPDSQRFKSYFKGLQQLENTVFNHYQEPHEENKEFLLSTKWHLKREKRQIKDNEHTLLADKGGFCI